MESWKKIGKALLFPHIAVMIILLLVATAFLIYAMVFIGTETMPAYISYMLTTFGADTMTLATRKLFLALSGGAISVFIVVMSVYMIIRANKRLKDFRGAVTELNHRE